jgi:hypothetical protein
MRAIVLEKFGGPDSLVIKEIPEPEPGAGHVVIQVKAFGINHAGMHTLVSNEVLAATSGGFLEPMYSCRSNEPSSCVVRNPAETHYWKLQTHISSATSLRSLRLPFFNRLSKRTYGWEQNSRFCIHNGVTARTQAAAGRTIGGSHVGGRLTFPI